MSILQLDMRRLLCGYLEGHVPVHDVVGRGRDGPDEGAERVILRDEDALDLAIVQVLLVVECALVSAVRQSRVLKSVK